jgi:hypothetical protein
MEIRTMKKNRLRGMLLGVSLALLLSGGVASAQDLFLRVFKNCVECWPGRGIPTEDRYLLPFRMGGWDTNYPLCERVTIDGELLGDICIDSHPPPDPHSDFFWIYCEKGPVPTSLLCGGEASIANGPPDPLGQWKVELYQEIPEKPDPHTEASFLVAEDCAAAMFVPEQGSILLLGSGLVGLAGYATLRWRSRE